MGQLIGTQVEENSLLDPPPRVDRFSEENLPWQIAQDMTEAGASAVGLPGGFLMTGRLSRQPGVALVPIREATQRLEKARTLASVVDRQMLVIACTHAREAHYVMDDEDSRDRRYLSGARSVDGCHVYCGGMDASISRALAYAPHADVVCYYSSKLDLAEGERFAYAIRASFPDKRLGIGFSQTVHNSRGIAIDPSGNDRILHRLGYDYFFYIQSGSVAFSAFPKALPWALFSDGIDPVEHDGPHGSHGSFRLNPPVRSRSMHRRCKERDDEHCC